jgi:hypothetical protein
LRAIAFTNAGNQRKQFDSSIRGAKMAKCSICGQDVADSRLTDGICDACLSGPPNPPAITRRPSPPMPRPEPPAEAETEIFEGEEVLLRDDQLIVTSLRCIMASRTFFMSSINAVETRSVQDGASISPHSAAAAALLFILAGVLFVLSSAALLLMPESAYAVLGLALSAAFFVASLFVVYRTRRARPSVTAWTVVAFTAVGPIEVTRSTDRKSCEHVATILNRARTARRET